MIRKKDDPVPAGTLIRERMRVRQRRGVYWNWEGRELRIPAGALGVIVRWKDFGYDNYGRETTLGAGCAVQFDHQKHPHYNAFPMERRDINWDVLPDSLEAA